MIPDPDRDITIPLARVQQNQIGNKNEYVKIVQESYANQYLQALGVEPTSRHRKMVTRHAPLDQCDIEALWGEDSALAMQLRIQQPQIGRIAVATAAESRGSEPSVVDRGLAMGLGHGFVRSASVAPPSVPSGFAARRAGKAGLDQQELRAAAERERERALLGMRAHDLAASEGADAALTEELEQLRRRARGDSRADTEPVLMQWGEEGQAELAALKRKFILPFAAERGAPGKADAELMLWQAPELMAKVQIQVPKDLRGEVLRPVEITLQQIMQEAVTYVDGRLPLELLTTRRDPYLFAAVREQLSSPGAVRLTGLLSHYLYWMVFGHLHPPAQRLPEATQDSLVLTIQELWARLVEPARQRHGRRAELLVRDTPAGMCFLLPVFLLGLKRGVEYVFHTQYQRVFSDPDYGVELGSQLVDQINVQLMHLFDPDCAHASFGALDSSVETMKMWRKLHVLQMKLGLTPATRMIGREFRTTPVVNLLVAGGGPGDPRTRMLLRKSGSESALGRSSKAARPRPPVDERRETVLYRTVRGRLASSGLEQLSGGRASSALA